MNHTEPQVSFLVLDFCKEGDSRACLRSIRDHVKIPHKVVYLDNGSGQNYPWKLYAEEELCDVIISKRVGRGGGFGQTDLFRWCDTKYAIFVQNDQKLVNDIGDNEFYHFVSLLNSGFKIIDLNMDQSGLGVWTDRAHMIETEFFNSLGPFPNGGPGNDALPWNEAYLQKVFKERNYKIAHITGPLFFEDCGKWSVREAGDGLFKHRCDTKRLYVLREPTYKTEVYPPLNDEEWVKVLGGNWIDGDIPEAWKKHSFEHWKD